MPDENKETEVAKALDMMKVARGVLTKHGYREDGQDPVMGERGREDDAAKTWEDMSPKERLDLYYSDRDRWQQLGEAARSKNERTLLGLNR